MALGELINKLIEEKEGKLIPQYYDPRAVAEAYSSVRKLGELNLSTPKGLKEYSEITGEDVRKYSPQMIELRREAWRDSEKELILYADKHFENLVKEIPEELQAHLAFNFAPQSDIPGENKRDYNATRRVIYRAKEINRKIRESPDEVFEEEMKRETSPIDRYLQRYKNRFLEVLSSDIMTEATVILNLYGSSRFLSETKFHVVKRQEEYRTKERDIQKRLHDKLSEESKKSKRPLSSLDVAEISQPFMEELKKLGEEYGDDVNSARSIIPTVLDLAVRAISEKDRNKNSS